MAVKFPNAAYVTGGIFRFVSQFLNFLVQHKYCCARRRSKLTKVIRKFSVIYMHMSIVSSLLLFIMRYRWLF